jgi:hypothetical protein
MSQGTIALPTGALAIPMFTANHISIVLFVLLLCIIIQTSTIYSCSIPL